MLTWVGYTATGSKLESALVTYQITRNRFPSDYLRRLRLRLPWFISLENKDSFAHLAAGNRPSAESQLILGPFSTKETAQAYEQSVNSLFQLRRCTDLLQPSTGHPGCIYGEMAHCLRPCQLGVTVEEYHTEAQRVQRFLLGNGRHEISDLTVARDRAIDATEFEQARLIHARIEKLKGAATLRPEVVSTIADFSGLAVVPATEQNSVKIWPLLGGHWQDAIHFRFKLQDEAPKSLDSDLKERVLEAWNSAGRDWNVFEALAIFSRWYHSSNRDGLWLPFRDPENLRYRKLVNAISLVSKGASVRDMRS